MPQAHPSTQISGRPVADLLSNAARSYFPCALSPREQTLEKSVAFEGTGLHSGKTVSMTVRPADPGSGVLFYRNDLPGYPPIPAKSDSVSETFLCTALSHKKGAFGTPGNNVVEIESGVETVEHLLSAVSALSLSNLRVDLEGPEIPVLDGSALCFVEKLLQAGLAEQEKDRHCIEILKPIVLDQGGSSARLEPFSGRKFSADIDFTSRSALVGRQQFEFDLDKQSYACEIAPARTFGFFEEVESLHKSGKALGGSLDNAVVVKGETILNREPLRFPDEFVRHKILDSIGDLFLAGQPILGHYIAHRPSHELNRLLLCKLLDAPGSWRSVKLSAIG